MREFYTREAEGNYSITFETDDRKAFEKVQRLQMQTQEGCNVKVCGIEGNFDDAQTGVKKAFEKVQELCRMLIDCKDCEAIPVEWLANFCYKCEKETQQLSEIRLAVETWRKENE